MPEEPTPLPTARHTPVPTGIFAADRLPPFIVFTATGARAPLESLDGARAGAADDAGDAGDDLYVSTFDSGALRDYLRTHLHAILAADAVPLDDRAWALHRTLLGAAAGVTALDEPGASRDLVYLARELASFVRRDPAAFGALNALLGGAYTAASHAVATAIVAVALAAADGVDDLERLTGVALGGLFADVGKVELAGETIDRRGPLTDEEWERMLRHPKRSAERLRESGVVLAQAVRGALHHHERWDGSGYPEQRPGREIPVEARYVAIADAFSAMTADRPYRPTRSAYEALSEMVTDGGFEPRLLRVFVPLLRAA